MVSQEKTAPYTNKRQIVNAPTGTKIHIFAETTRQ
jgi:hypothetical protein